MCLMYSLWNKLTHYKNTPCLSFIVRQFTLNETELFSLIFATAQYEHKTEFSMNPSESDVAFVQK